ncbi:MAG TPA: hypothetical protein VKA48_07450 [Gammaproteobacteria bacterium]|nr:hypothetical protein [Gammaproteobacteria bacterium]
MSHIFDVACYPYVSLADEADVSLSNYPTVRDWLQRLAQLPGWVAMDA